MIKLIGVFPKHPGPESGRANESTVKKLLNKDLRVYPREDQEGVTHAISPISLKLSQIIKVTELFKSPK